MVHIIFIHLDLGIGGAEQLILQLAQASLAIDSRSSTTESSIRNTSNSSSSNSKQIVDLDIVTTRCDANHCFATVKPTGPAGNNNLYPHLRIYGRWIPASLVGDKGRALMSTIRLLYLAYCVARQHHQWRTTTTTTKRKQVLFSSSSSTIPSSRNENAENSANDGDSDDDSDDNDDEFDDDTLIVMDVLPTPLPFLRWTTNAALLFYCHFPDQLLTRTTSRNSNTSSRRWYRSVFDALENRTMQYADTIVVNSQFTRRTVEQTFPFLQQQQQQQDVLPVLYPALDTSSLDKNKNNTDSMNTNDDNMDPKVAALLKRRPIVSLNRYERKKNLELLLQAIQWIQQQQEPSILLEELPPIIIAGGYDVQNVENVQYLRELQDYCHEHKLTKHVTFWQSISDATRCQLLHCARVVVYTPTNEHFGIVPLEAMYSATPVICCNSGGPVETVLHETTGFLCPPTAAAFGQAILTLLQDPARATIMGLAARAHVVNKFGQERLHQEWKHLVYDTIQKSRSSTSTRLTQRQYRLVRCVLYVMEAVVTLGACLCLVYCLRRLNLILEPSETIWKVLRQVISGSGSSSPHNDETSPTMQEL
jgi:alpha-1,3/alpha-1,6-mannosyltransferase